MGPLLRLKTLGVSCSAAACVVVLTGSLIAVYPKGRATTCSHRET